jgi:hypothetical protein
MAVSVMYHGVAAAIAIAKRAGIMICRQLYLKRGLTMPNGVREWRYGVGEVFPVMRMLWVLAVLGGAACGQDIVIYGGTPAGLAAARAAVRETMTVVVIEPGAEIGGMITGGIAVTDTGTPQFVGGVAREFFEEVARTYPPDQPMPRLLFRGRAFDWTKPRAWDLEPKTARRVFARWVKEDGYRLLMGRQVTGVRKAGAAVTGITLSDGATVAGKVFIDASYEGDLMARAGVAYTYGRESAQTYGEKLAGRRAPHFVRNYEEIFYRAPGHEYMHHGQFGADIRARDAGGRLLWGVTANDPAAVGSGDRRVQAYCYRLIATQREDLRVAWPKPRTYRPERYALLLRYVLAHTGISFARLVHFGSIPNGKFDLNASGPFSIDYIGGNQGYPDADYARRVRFDRDHEDYEKGFLWFLAHDPRVPRALREEVNTWGLCRDEYPENGHWPRQLYMREARRMQGAYIMTERDILTDKRKDDSVGMGSFVLDSHWVQRFEDEQGFVRVEGHLDESVNLSANPYEIPYRSLTPQAAQCRNLLVPVCLSASHVAVCTIRMEPVYMILGHAAGVAAAMAVKSGAAVQEIGAAALLEKLKAQGAVLHKSQPRR